MEVSGESKKKTWVHDFNSDKYRVYVTAAAGSEEIDEKAVDVEDLEKREEAYGICEECNEPGTGWKWCQPCNAKRFRENFENWTSGNQDIDKFIQQSQLDAVYSVKCLEWIPYENFRDVKYITRGGFGKIYTAKWPEGYIWYWDIEKQEWKRVPTDGLTVALKSLDNSSNISRDFIDEIKSHLQLHFVNIVRCYGITQDPNTNAKDYMMVLQYCDNGDLRNYLNKGENYKVNKIENLTKIASGLLDIHNADKVHKDFHSGNILFDAYSFISDLGMCQPANDQKQEGIFGVLPYMAPEVLCNHQYTKASDIYSFGVVMNEFISEEIPYSDIPHDYILAVKICKGLRPKISEDTPKLLADLIMKCWDAEAKKRPTAKELHQTLKRWEDEGKFANSDICKKIGGKRFKNNSSGSNKSSNIRTHPQAIYTSRLLNYKNLPEPVNSSDLSFFQLNSESIPTAPVNPISEFLDTQLSELDLNEDNNK